MVLVILVLTLTIILPLLAFVVHLLKPNPEKHPDPKSLSELIKNGHRIVEWTSDLTTASSTGTVTAIIGVVTADPTTVEHITKTKFESYIKGNNSISILHDFLGDGIFNSDGDQWKLQRRTASLEFSTKVIRTFVMSNIHSQVATRLLPALHSRAEHGIPFDLQELLERFAFDNVCKVVFDGDLDRLGLDSPDGKEFNEAFERASKLCVARFSSLIPGLWKLKRILNVGSEKELREKIAIVHRFATKAVRSRKISSLGDDLLSRFIAENGDYSDEFLRDVIVSFVLAGRDTTSATLTWFLWEIGRRPDIEKKILKEIKRVRGKDENFQVFSLSQVREMEYMHAVMSETLRLHPPVPLQPRTCAEDDVLPDGTKVIKKGMTVYYNSYAMGRSRRIWGEDCEEFRPERWLDEDGVFQPRSPYMYPVFHAGPRMCLGKDMAYIQMKVVAGMMVERFEVEVVEKEKVREHELILIMKMKGGLMVKVKERK